MVLEREKEGRRKEEKERGRERGRKKGKKERTEGKKEEGGNYIEHLEIKTIKIGIKTSMDSPFPFYFPFSWSSSIIQP